MNIHRSHQQTVDDAIRKACRVLSIIGLPILLVSTYRNLYVDFLPLHSTLMTIIYLSFVALSLDIIRNSNIRLYALSGTFLGIFILSGARNESFLNVDIWLIFAGCILAFRVSYLWLAITLTVAVSILLFLLQNSNIYLEEPYFVPMTLHIASLSVSFVIFTLIKNVILNYQKLYEDQAETNVGLIEKSKRSYLLAQEAEEDKEEEKQRLRTGAYSLYSQISTLQNIIKFAEDNNDQKSLQDGREIIKDIQGDLLEFSKSGKYIKSQTSKLTISDLAYVLESHVKPYAKVSSGDFSCSITSEDKSLDDLEIPIHYIKLIAHHLIQHCRENHQAKELKFNIQKGAKARSMQQIKLSVFVYSIEDLSETDFSNLNREMASKSHLNIGDNHIRFIKILLQGMSGSFKASSIGNTARYDMSFWVD